MNETRFGNTAAVCASKLTKRFGRHAAVDKLDLDVAAGRIF
jgi:ABC-type uncharacterized transport system ATPase subunit